MAKRTDMINTSSSTSSTSARQGDRSRDDWSQPRLARALAGDSAELARLIDDLTRVIRARVGQALARSGAVARCGEARFDAEDITQDVLMRLFGEDGELLRRWDPTRGLSLRNFAGLVAQRYVFTVLRRQRLHREDALPAERLCEVEATSQRTVERLEASQELELVLAVLRDRISARAMRIVELIHLEGRSVVETCEELGTTPNALYAACTRIRKQTALIAIELELCNDGASFFDATSPVAPSVAVAA